MDHEVGPWKMVQLPWSDFLNHQVTKLSVPSLGVNLMWTENNDHTPKSECVDLFWCVSKKGNFEKEKKFKFDHSFVFIFSSPITFLLKKSIRTIILCHGPLPFKKKLEHLFCFSHRKTRWTMSVGKVGLTIWLLETTNSMVTLTLFFPWCEQKWSQVEFNNQSQILQSLGTTTWSMV